MIPIQIGKSEDTPIRLKELIKNFSLLKKIPSEEVIDLTQVEWVTPLSILPLALLIDRWQKKGVKLTFPSDHRIKSYLETILFPEGTTEPKIVEIGKTYFPIVKVAHSEEKFPSEILEKVYEKYQTLLSSLLKEQPYSQDVSQALAYFLAEMVDNVEEHSFAKEFWIFSQYWPISGKIEICLLDDGIGFFHSYKNAEIFVKDDVDAIGKAIKGISSKKAEGQGYGIPRSIYLITESSLNGEFLIISGRAGYFKKNREKGKIFWLNKIGWRGVIIMIKVHKPSSSINLYDFIE